MANLSNINGKFVVEQTTGYVGVGTTDPNFLIEAAGANSEIALNSTSASIYRLRSTSSDSFIITKNGVGDRLTINGGGDATFAGELSIPSFIRHTGDTNTYIGFPSDDTIKLVTASNEIIRIDSSGNINVGEGTNPKGNILMGNTVVNPASGFADQTGIGLKNSATVPELQVSSDSTAMQLGRTTTGGDGQIMAMRKASVIIHSFDTNNVSIGTNATFAGNVTTAQINLNSSGGGIIDNQTGNIFIQTPSGTGWIFRNGASGYDEKMRIDSSGNVGIGTDDPDYPLHVKNSSTSYLFSETTGPGAAAGFRWKTPDSEFSWYSAGGLNNMNLYDYTASAVRMTIDSDGNAIFTKNVTVGTAAASDFVLSLRGGVGGFFGWDDSTNKTILQAPNTRQLSLRVNSDTFGAGTEAILIDSSGNVGIANSNPSGNAVGENGKSFIVGNESATAESASISIISGSGGYSYLLFGDGDGVSGYQGQVRYQHSSNNLQFVTGAAERMRIKSDGVITFSTTAGTSTPAGSINHASNNFLYVTGGIAGASFGDDSHATRMIVFDNNYLRFDTGGTERMRIDSSGNVTVNEGNLFLGATSSKTGTAYFWSNANDSRMSIANTGSAFEIRSTYLSTAGYKPIEFYTSDVKRLTIETNGMIQAIRGDAGDLFYANSTSSAGSGIINYNSSLAQQSNNTSCSHFKGTTQNIASYHLYGNGSSSWSSDSRLKRDIKTTRDGYIDDINKLRVVKYKWKNDENSGLELGLIAQEVEKIFPSLVVDHEDAVGNGETYKSLKYSVLPTILLKGMQEQQKMIQELKAEIEILKNK